MRLGASEATWYALPCPPTLLLGARRSSSTVSRSGAQQSSSMHVGVQSATFNHAAVHEHEHGQGCTSRDSPPSSIPEGLISIWSESCSMRAPSSAEGSRHPEREGGLKATSGWIQCLWYAALSRRGACPESPGRAQAEGRAQRDSTYLCRYGNVFLRATVPV